MEDKNIRVKKIDEEKNLTPKFYLKSFVANVQSHMKLFFQKKIFL